MCRRGVVERIPSLWRDDRGGSLLKWEMDPACADTDQTPSSGGRWSIKCGNMINLPELVWHAHEQLTLYDIYKIWLTLPKLALKRKHSESHSDKANLARNAKELKYQEIGRRGLNEPRARGPARDALSQQKPPAQAVRRSHWRVIGDG